MGGDILFLAHRFPYPPDRGDRMRSWHILKALAERAPVHLGCFADGVGDPAHKDVTAGLCASQMIVPQGFARYAGAACALARGSSLSVAMFDDARLRHYVRDLVTSSKVGTIFAFSGQMAQFVPADFQGCFIMDFVDVDSAKFDSYGREGSGPKAWLYASEGQRLAKFESAVAGRADVSLFVSEAEAALFRERTNLNVSKVRALENGIDLDFYDPVTVWPRPDAAGERPYLLFTGQMDYRPNADAVIWFAKQVLPKLSGVRFVIAGRAPTAEVQALANDPNVIVTGAVDDIRPWQANANIIIAPLLIARGIQNKVLEAMAMAKPVVASPQAFEGIKAEPGRDLLVAEEAGQFAVAIQSLLIDPNRAGAMSISARAAMEARYGWSARLALLDDLIGPVNKAFAA